MFYGQITKITKVFCHKNLELHVYGIFTSLCYVNLHVHVGHHYHINAVKGRVQQLLVLVSIPLLTQDLYLNLDQVTHHHPIHHAVSLEEVVHLIVHLILTQDLHALVLFLDRTLLQVDHVLLVQNPSRIDLRSLIYLTTSCKHVC